MYKLVISLLLYSSVGLSTPNLDCLCANNTTGKKKDFLCSFERRGIIEGQDCFPCVNGTKYCYNWLTFCACKNSNPTPPVESCVSETGTSVCVDARTELPTLMIVPPFDTYAYCRFEIESACYSWCLLLKGSTCQIAPTPTPPPPVVPTP